MPSITHHELDPKQERELNQRLQDAQISKIANLPSKLEIVIATDEELMIVDNKSVVNRPKRYSVVTVSFAKTFVIFYGRVLTQVLGVFTGFDAEFVPQYISIEGYNKPKIEEAKSEVLRVRKPKVEEGKELEESSIV